MGENRRILRLIFQRLDYSFDAIFTYLVSCRATKEALFNYEDNDRPPTPSEIERCGPKLQEVFNFTEYEAIIYLGKASTSNKIPSYTMQHPEEIAKMEYRLFSIKEQALLLNNFLKERYDKSCHLQR